jgi:hypothetical protein
MMWLIGGIPGTTPFPAVENNEFFDPRQKVDWRIHRCAALDENEEFADRL